MPSNLHYVLIASFVFWGLSWCVLWSTRELNTRPIRPDWRKIWMRRVFGIWFRYLAIFTSIFSGLWMIHGLGGFWDVLEMTPREKSQVLKAGQIKLAAVLDNGRNQVKGLIFLFLLYADHLFERRTQPEGADAREGPEWSLRFLLASIGALLFMSIW